MSDLETRLTQIFDRIQTMVLKDDHVLGALLRRLGETQVVMDSAAEGSMDQESFSQLKTQMLALNLDDATKAKLLALAGKNQTMNNGRAFQFIEDAFSKLRSIQTSAGSGNADPNELVSQLNKFYSQARSEVDGAIRSLNLKESSIMGALEKIAGTRK
ncbi:hypothetical protein [Paenibacillus pinistramenti]|uniref:hypothetical protein n=1 Tax=Paenibacillus pinistramenti TaxID=1768003 RepID=UPI001109E814|nr:hypothetical protein [Paenibacillus pinistramenti]